MALPMVTEDSELVNMNLSDVSEESARCSDNNVEVSGVVVTEFDQVNGLCTHSDGSIAELDDKRVKADDKVSAATHEEHIMSLELEHAV